jgi:hypothetical protein
MLEMCNNQGAGLQRIAMQVAPRVMALASHGDQQGELPLLWHLCTALVGLGQPVAVLDATTFESVSNPGLFQMLDDADWCANDSRDPLSWSVLPAALGLQQLCADPAPAGQALEPLSKLFQSFGVVVIYARADVLSRLLIGSCIEPLLTVAPVKRSALTAYQALKQMVLDAKLRPFVANIAAEADSGSATANPAALKNLQKCSMTFLDYPLDSLVVHALPSQECCADDIQRLALQLLERAMPLQRNHFVGSH